MKRPTTANLEAALSTVDDKLTNLSNNCTYSSAQPVFRRGRQQPNAALPRWNKKEAA